MANAKLKIQGSLFNLANQKLNDFLDEPHKLTKDTFGVAAQDIIGQFIWAPEKINEPAHLENGTYAKIFEHLERMLEPDGLRAALDQLQKITASRSATNANVYEPKLTCHDCKEPGHYETPCRQKQEEKQQTEDSRDIAGNFTSGTIYSSSNSYNLYRNY